MKITTSNIEQSSTIYEHEPVYVHDICNCGCSKITVPYHLKDEPLAVRVYPMRNQRYISCQIKFEGPEIDDKGWKKE